MACAGAADRAVICAEVLRCPLRMGSGSRWPQTLLDTDAAFGLALVWCPPMPIPTLPAIALQVAVPAARGGLWSSLSPVCRQGTPQVSAEAALQGDLQRADEIECGQGTVAPRQCMQGTIIHSTWVAYQQVRRATPGVQQSVMCSEGCSPFCRKLGVEAIHKTPRSWQANVLSCVCRC